MKKTPFIIVLALLGCSLGMLSPVTTMAKDKGQTFLTVPMPPEFVPSKDQEGSIKYITGEEIEELFKAYSKKLRTILYNKQIKKFIVPDATWLLALLDTFQEFLYQQQLRWEPDSWDCENFCMLLDSFATIRLWRAGITDTRCAFGWMMVDARTSWAGIPPEVHALMFCVTKEGIIVIEPQNGMTTYLKDYPNRKYIEEVYLF